MLPEQNSPLCESTIRDKLDSQTNKLLEILHITDETESTNILIHNFQPQRFFSVVLSESQTRGQGRRSKCWYSPSGVNIYLSISFYLTRFKQLQFLPLITGLAVCRTLSVECSDGCQIKWPNDIYLGGKKLGGILVEAKQQGERCKIISGIGLNINMRSGSEIDQQWTSLSKHSNNNYNRNDIIARLLTELVSTYNKLSDFDLTGFMCDWNKYDYLNQKKILVSDDLQIYEAKVLGLADDGALKVSFWNKTQNRITKKKIYSAEVSVKPA